MRTLTKNAQAWWSEERRKEARYRMILRVGLLEQDGKSSLCLVKNISPTGVQVKLYSKAMPGVPLIIRVADEPPLRGHLVWVKGDLAGISFEQELDPAVLLRVQQKLAPNRRRAMPRLGVHALATLHSGGHVYRARLCDISSVGARVTTSRSLMAGDRALVELRGLPAIKAFVRWSDGEESGLAFETPVPMQILASWIDSPVRLTA